MLLFTLVPTIKDKLGSINISKNYKSLYITSLILKQFDWIVISLFGKALGFHDFQFDYQPGASANMCSWADIETIDYFLRNGSDVSGCSLDIAKPFMIASSPLSSIKCRSVSVQSFFRLIIYIYVEHFSNIIFNEPHVHDQLLTSRNPKSENLKQERT